MFLCFALSAGIALGQGLPPAEIPLERFYKYPLISGRSPSGAKMSPDGRKIVFGWNRTGERRLDVWILDFPNGQPKQIVEANKIERLPRQDDERTEQEKKEETLYDGGIGGFTWSPDSKDILFQYRGRSWLVSPDGSNLRPISQSNEGFGQASFSPDGQFIGFLRGQNLYRMDRRTGMVTQLTFVSKTNTSVNGYSWSPDGKHVAVTWSNTSKLGNHVMMDFSKDKATVVNIRRNWHGEKSTDVQVGVVPIAGGLIKFIDKLPRYTWLNDFSFSPDGSMLLVTSFTEDFMKYEIRVIPISSMKTAVVYDEKAPKNYIPDFRPAVWSRDSRNIYFATDIIGGQFSNRSVMKIRASGGTPEKVYAEGHDVAAMDRPKDSDRLILVTMSKGELRGEITVLNPDGKRSTYDPLPTGWATDVGFDEAAVPLFSDDGTRIASLCSDRKTPRELYAIEPVTKRLTVSPGPEFEKVKWADFQEVSFPGPDGKTISGVLITKPGIDKSKKHPAFISNMYANSAKQNWAGFFENYAAMELGFVVLQIDFRASWGQGGEFNSGYYKSMGVIDADEAVAGKAFLDSLGYVQPDRVGLWGWSYGGFLTCMVQLTKPGVFHAGVAVASVTDWKSYNEWYTRRRLGLETEDAETYKKTSPIHHAAGLKNHLLLIHGILDDNVLFQDTGRLMQRLIENNKHFDLMLYPRDDHGIGKDESRPHVMVEIMEYLYRRLYEPSATTTGG
ncbi:MAG: Dipeptidyl aminopeptidase 4 [Fimbriimonadaceae bacterium]|nr:Dipeptidyl aminopeptidase 4 [Fimbriimonadaceae bacterium]